MRRREVSGQDVTQSQMESLGGVSKFLKRVTGTHPYCLVPWGAGGSVGKPSCGGSALSLVLTLSPLGPAMPAAPLSPGIPCRPGGP